MQVKTVNRKSRLRGWGLLLLTFFLLWVFAVVVGPWLRPHIPYLNQIVAVAEQQDIDMGAYFYTEIEASYDGEQYLKGALDLGAPGEAAFNPFAVAGLALCLFILWLGYRYLPLE